MDFLPDYLHIVTRTFYIFRGWKIFFQQRQYVTFKYRDNPSSSSIVWSSTGSKRDFASIKNIYRCLCLCSRCVRGVAKYYPHRDVRGAQFENRWNNHWMTIKMTITYRAECLLSLLVQNGSTKKKVFITLISFDIITDRKW